MLKFLVPKFMKEFDKKLLLNYPFWYIVKIHYIVYFTTFMWLLSYVIGSVLPIEIYSYNPENVTAPWIFVFVVLGIILLCVWMYYLTIYNNEDHFGKFRMWDDTKLLLVLIIGLNLLMSFSYPMQLRFKMRLANTFSDKALAEQYNNLNLAHKYMTHNIEDFQYCGYDIHDTVNYNILKRDTSGQFNYDLSKYKNFKVFSSENYYNYRFYNYSLFHNLFNFKESYQFGESLLDEIQIEQEYRLHKTDADILKAINNYFEVNLIYLNGYDRYNKYTPQDYFDNYKHIEKRCSSFFPEAYNVKPEDKLKEGYSYLPFQNPSDHLIGNIYAAKFTVPFILSNGYLLFAFYFSFFISLLIILFRNNKWQHYLVSVVSFILVIIIISIISLVLGFSGTYSKNIYPTLLLLIYFTTGVISLIYYFKKDKYRVLGVVATNLFYFGLPIMPFFLCIYAHEVFDWLKCQNSFSSNPIEILECMIYDRTYDDALFYAQIVGIALFVIVVMPFYKLFFTKQKALPRDK